MIKRQYFFTISICMLCLFWSKLYAQAPLDSLKSKLPLVKDSLRADTYNQISWQFRNKNADSAYYYAEKGFTLSQTLDYSSGMTHGLNYMGVALRNKSRYYEAMKMYFKALKIAEENADMSQISYALVNIGNIYLYQTNYAGAYQYFDRSLKNAIELKDDQLAAYCHINLGRSYVGMKEYSKAKPHIIKALMIRKNISDQDGLAIANLDLGNLYLIQNELDGALNIISKNIEQLIVLGHQNTLANSYNSIAQVYLLKNDLERALVNIQTGLEVCKKNKLKNEEVQALKILADIYESQNQPSNALSALKQHICNKDSIYNANNTRKIDDLFSKYTYEKSEIEKHNLEVKTELNEMVIRRQRAIILLSMVIIISFLIIAMFAYKSSAQQRRLNDQIRTQKDNTFRHNTELIDINNEKNNLIRILSHDLRAPLNNIKGLIQVHQMDHQKEFTEAENEVLNLVKSESDRLLNMIKKILNVEAMDDDKKEIKYEKVDVNALTKDLVMRFQNTAKTKAIKINSSFLEDPAYILGDQIHLYQVMENLLSNAIKFTDHGKEVSVGLSLKKNKINIIFQDEGPGLTKDDEEKIFKKFQTLSAKPTGNEESTGLGLSIVKKYVYEMNGNIEYNSVLGSGTTFIISFDQVSPSV